MRNFIVRRGHVADTCVCKALGQRSAVAVHNFDLPLATTTTAATANGRCDHSYNQRGRTQVGVGGCLVVVWGSGTPHRVVFSTSLHQLTRKRRAREARRFLNILLFLRLNTSSGMLQGTFQANFFSSARTTAHNNKAPRRRPAHREGPTAAHHASQDDRAWVQNSRHTPLRACPAPIVAERGFYSRHPARRTPAKYEPIKRPSAQVHQ
jgi:hypothetical protein